MSGLRLRGRLILLHRQARRIGKTAPRMLSFWILLAFLVAIVGLATLPQPNTLVSASIRTETVSIGISNPDASAFTLPAAEVFDGSSMEGRCLNEVSVFPQSGSKLFLTRERAGDLIVMVDGPSYVEAPGSLALTESLNAQMIVSPDGPCAIAGGLRLPVAGQARIGIAETGARSQGEPSLVIWDGLLTIYGRATPTIMGIPVEYLKPVPMEGDRLYRAGDFRLPAGSEVSSDTAYWQGFVDVDFETGPGFRFEASTNARSLDLIAPAPRAVRGGADATDALEADEISMTFGARLGNDPNLRWFFASVSFVLFFVSVIFQVIRTKDEI